MGQHTLNRLPLNNVSLLSFLVRAVYIDKLASQTNMCYYMGVILSILITVEPDRVEFLYHDYLLYTSCRKSQSLFRNLIPIGLNRLSLSDGNYDCSFAKSYCLAAAFSRRLFLQLFSTSTQDRHARARTGQEFSNV